MTPALSVYAGAMALLRELAAWPVRLAGRRAGEKPSVWAGRLWLDQPKLTRRSGPGIWIQASSVGEVRLAAGICARIKEERPEIALTLSTWTETGQAEARKLAGQLADIIYFPLDAPQSVGRALKAVGPSLTVLVETEMWPYFLHRTAASGLPTIMINGRISARSIKGYRRVKALFKPLLAGLDRIGAISRVDADRFVSLGARPERVTVTGNAKIDSLTGQARPDQADELGRLLGLIDRPSLVAGSVRLAEADQVIAAFGQIKAAVNDAVLVLAPRHLNRLEAVERLISDRGLSLERRSRMTVGAAPAVIVVDTMGELLQIYKHASVAFIGASLIPKGGHNPLEPAYWGRPVLFGPYMDDFSDPAQVLLQAGGAETITDADGLAEAAITIMTDDHKAAAMGRAAARACSAQMGAAEKTVNLVLEVLDRTSPATT